MSRRKFLQGLFAIPVLAAPLLIPAMVAEYPTRPFKVGDHVGYMGRDWRVHLIEDEWCLELRRNSIVASPDYFTAGTPVTEVCRGVPAHIVVKINPDIERYFV